MIQDDQPNVNSTLVRKIRPLTGTYKVSSDESIIHRALFILSQSFGKSTITNFRIDENIIHSIRCLKSLGIRINKISNDSLEIYGLGIGGFKKPKSILETGSSRIATSLLIGSVATYPFYSYVNCNEKNHTNFENSIMQHLTKIGTEFTSKGFPTAIIGSHYIIPEIHMLEQSSSQVKSALIMAALNTKGRTTIIEPYSGSRDHTELMLKGLGCDVIIKYSKENKKVIINGFPEIKAVNMRIPGDPSIAAFLVAAAILLPGSDLIIDDICLNPIRIKIYQILQKMGADIKFQYDEDAFGEKIGKILVKSSTIHGVTIKENHIPMDNFPIFLIIAAYAEGQTIIESNKKLKILSSNKISTVINNLKELGVNIEINDNQIIINGGKIDGGSSINVINDYAVCMSFIVCSFGARKSITIYNHEKYWFNLFYNKN
jgi:3-phosphoshikimate 1-carboxyvinyltransferase